MGLISEIWRAFWAMALPVGLFSFGLVWWAVYRGYLRGDGGVSGVGKEIKALSTERKRLKKQRAKIKKGKAEEPEQPLQERKFDPLQEKWMKFGGGFYGVVAFYTYVLIEWREIADFIANFGGFFEMIQRVSLGAVIELIVNSIVNFVAAIAWPVYWISRADQAYLWVWFATAYGGYWLGIRLALTVQQGWFKDWLVTPRDVEDDD
jgi:hypothetical protein